MARRGNPYDNAMMESFMKTLKVEGVYPMAFESEEDVACHLPRFIDSYNERRLQSALGWVIIEGSGLETPFGGLFSHPTHPETPKRQSSTGECPACP